MRSFNHHGYILMAVLIAAALLALPLTGALYGVRHLQRLHADEVHTGRVRAQLNHRLIDALPEICRSGAGRLQCRADTAAVGRRTMRQELCLLCAAHRLNLFQHPIIVGAPSTDRARFPIFDLAPLFAAAQPCGNAAAGHRIRLTGSAAQSALTCRNPRPTPRGITVRGNLESTALLIPASLSAGAAAEPFVIAAAGYIDIDTQITVNRPVIIVAGGDLRLRAAAAAPGTPAQLTLIAATGAATVLEIDPLLPLRVIAWSAAAVPDYALPSTTPPFPALLNDRAVMTRDTDNDLNALVR